uniref:Cytochrome P450 n=1 Tax=Oryza nivara TaxID=4536 RepID=A0A0E0J1A0_ORYNI
MATELLASSQLLPWQPLVQLLAAVLFLLLPLVYLLFFKGDGNGGVMDSASAPSPPGPPRQLPVLGNLLQIGSRPHRYFQAVAWRYGPVVQVQLGSIRTVVVHSPEAAKDVLRTNDLQCCSRPSSPGNRSKPIYICTWLGYCQQPKAWMDPSFLTVVLGHAELQSSPSCLLPSHPPLRPATAVVIPRLPRYHHPTVGSRSCWGENERRLATIATLQPSHHHTTNYLDVAVSPYSAYWREMRKLLVIELTSIRRVQSFAYARAAEVARLVDTLTASPAGVPVDLSSALYTFSDGVIGTVAFGKVYGSAAWSSSEWGGSFQEAMDETMQVVGSFSFEDFFPSSALARWADALTGAAGRRRRVFHRIDGFFDAVIDKHLEPERLSAGVQEGMVDAMVKVWREQKDEAFGLTRDHIKAILLDAFVGGIDTTVVTTTWIMSELMRNPRVMQKAQAEVHNIVKNKSKVCEEDIQNMKYLKMIIKENFRLHPPGTLLIPRQTMKTCTIGGYSVSSETRIYVNVWAMGRDPNIWDNPEQFYPERFEDKGIDFRGSHFEILPFRSGQRICPGIAMGVANVELVVANLLYCFDWQLPKGMKEEDIDMDEIGQLAFRKKLPLLIVPMKH